MDMLSGRPTVSLVIHRSQLLWRVSSLDSWFLDKAHDFNAIKLLKLAKNLNATKLLKKLDLYVCYKTIKCELAYWHEQGYLYLGDLGFQGFRV